MTSAKLRPLSEPGENPSILSRVGLTSVSSPSWLTVQMPRPEELKTARKRSSAVRRPALATSVERRSRINESRHDDAEDHHRRKPEQPRIVHQNPLILLQTPGEGRRWDGLRGSQNPHPFVSNQKWKGNETDFDTPIGGGFTSTP